MKGNDQKMKPFIIYDILQRETDSDHPMTTRKLIERLEAKGICSERKSIYEDIKVLNKFGYEVLTARGKSNMYYVKNRRFETAEIKILMDAVRGAGFITPVKTEILVDKIASLAGEHRAETLKSDVACIAAVKHTNEAVFDSVDVIGNCIVGNKQCSFTYFDFNCEGERVYRKEGARYVVNPVALVFNEDNYYLMAYSDKYSDVATYRVDRMDEVRAEGNAKKEARWLRNYDFARYRKQAFSMFSGTLTEVTLECDKSMTDVVTDKFGEDVEMIEADDKFKVKVRVQVSPTFFGWCATSGGKIKIKFPVKVRDLYREHLNKCLE